MTTRRIVAAICALTFPFAATACSSEEDALAEPDLSQEVSTTAEEATETTSERSSTTVSTVYETTTDADKKSPKKKETEKKEPAAAADTGSSKGPCKWKPVEEGSVGEEVSSYCDGRFARVGTHGTDDTVYLQWDGNDWVSIESSGKTFTGFKCYDGAHLDDIGVPDAMKNKMVICD
ncbi:hypothetical protein QYQ98_03740 [Corynebacterium sp. P3-F1]|uniref:hypothetical protein n=1 Tax=Corynebacterium sp. P3-F1 TaxID=3059080 RepID=UPI00265CB36C|nr:hypothetical protein [Corynebacterium sp. P3-F1]WKK62006.1 hypothetical protein QYQ98_03740 [Corynebacterium sp. P3-F1]